MIEAAVKTSADTRLAGEQIDAVRGPGSSNFSLEPVGKSVGKIATTEKISMISIIGDGQVLLPEMLPKIRRLRRICAERRIHPVIAVDGGEDLTTAGQAAAAGATAIVAGSAIFGTPDYTAAIAAIRSRAAAAWAKS
jgi:hypothetical protein